MKFNNRMILAGTLCVLGCTGTYANGTYTADDTMYYEYADVVDVQPIVRVVRVSTPQTTCWNEPARYQTYRYQDDHPSAVPAIVGGIIGSVIGKQFADGKGKRYTAVAGGLLGAAVGQDAARRRHARSYRAQYRSERHCEVQDVFHEEERIDGYRVTYVYQGREFVTRTAYDPGDRIRVRVQVELAAYN